jgi:sugar lactone lactonase YvrE
MTPLRRILLPTLVLLTAISPALAQQLYITNEPKSTLELLNLATGELSTLYDIGGKPDDLTLNPAGQLLYSVPIAGTVNLYDPATGTNSVLVSGVAGARDLFVEPGGQTMLIAIYSPGKIVRYNFQTGATVTLTTKLGTCDGIAYDAHGNLYAVANHNTIVQINPVSGAVLKTLTLEPHVGVNGGDGLTYDSFSDSLWATHDGTTGKGLIQIPVSAAGFTEAGFTSFLFTKALTGSAPDGIKSDGKGNLYIGAIQTAFVYNILTNTITKSVVVAGADGVSLVPGTF